MTEPQRRVADCTCIAGAKRTYASRTHTFKYGASNKHLSIDDYVYFLGVFVEVHRATNHAQ